MSALGRPGVADAGRRRDAAAGHHGLTAAPRSGRGRACAHDQQWIRSALRCSWLLFRYGRVGVRVKRSDGAKAWSTVLSELAQVRVAVQWERPAWRVSW